jgi:hypothetical protein
MSSNQKNGIDNKSSQSGASAIGIGNANQYGQQGQANYMGESGLGQQKGSISQHSNMPGENKTDLSDDKFKSNLSKLIKCKLNKICVFKISIFFIFINRVKNINNN